MSSSDHDDVDLPSNCTDDDTVSDPRKRAVSPGEDNGETAPQQPPNKKLKTSAEVDADEDDPNVDLDDPTKEESDGTESEDENNPPFTTDEVQFLSSRHKELEFKHTEGNKSLILGGLSLLLPGGGPKPPAVVIKDSAPDFIYKDVTKSTASSESSAKIPTDALASRIATKCGVQTTGSYSSKMHFEDSGSGKRGNADDESAIVDEDEAGSDEEDSNTTKKTKAKPQMTKKNTKAQPNKQSVQDLEAGVKFDLDTTVAPVHKLDDIFSKYVEPLRKLRFGDATAPLTAQSLRVVTMCSGTESPLLALNMINDAFVRAGERAIPINHLASAEIEPFKQAYIHRNFEPAILFRDVTEFSVNKTEGHTAFGAIAKQPTEVHMLIAGSSCVDYSSLNNSRKKYQEKGQSYDTMSGIRDYANRHRPAIVILENVSGAPWGKINEDWTRHGYFCVVMWLDSKDYYIPQTRRRGYMIAFDVKRAEEIGLNLRHAAKVVVRSMESLRQRASSPYPAFIYGIDDPDLTLARIQLAFERTIGNNIDWWACRMRYEAFRQELQIGPERPLTLWRNDGKSTFNKYGNVPWAADQRERIFDTLDINLLAYLSQRNYDMTYKSRFVELSQNVDRDQDRRQWGIVGCITPSGMPFDTLRGGPVIGKEALALQGIPIHNISLNKETSRQMQDLAGNAMTTTTIGAVIASAILASNSTVVTELSKDDEDDDMASGSDDDKKTTSTEVSMFRKFRPDS